jgi:hypothetical protein
MRDVVHKHTLVHEHVRGYGRRGALEARSVYQSEEMQAVLVIPHKLDMGSRLHHYWASLGFCCCNSTDSCGNGGKMQCDKVDGGGRDAGGSYELV